MMPSSIKQDNLLSWFYVSILTFSFSHDSCALATSCRSKCFEHNQTKSSCGIFCSLDRPLHDGEYVAWTFPNCSSIINCTEMLDNEKVVLPGNFRYDSPCNIQELFLLYFDPLHLNISSYIFSVFDSSHSAITSMIIQRNGHVFTHENITCSVYTNLNKTCLDSNFEDIIDKMECKENNGVDIDVKSYTNHSKTENVTRSFPSNHKVDKDTSGRTTFSYPITKPPTETKSFNAEHLNLEDKKATDDIMFQKTTVALSIALVCTICICIVLVAYRRRKQNIVHYERVDRRDLSSQLSDSTDAGHTASFQLDPVIPSEATSERHVLSDQMEAFGTYRKRVKHASHSQPLDVPHQTHRWVSVSRGVQKHGEKKILGVPHESNELSEKHVEHEGESEEVGINKVDGCRRRYSSSSDYCDGNGERDQYGDGDLAIYCSIGELSKEDRRYTQMSLDVLFNSADYQVLNPEGYSTM